MTDNTNDTADTFTTDSSPGEQAFESKVNDVAAFIAGVHSDDEYEPVFIDPKGGGEENGG